MDTKIKELIAVGAAAAVNCHPCLKYHVPKCIEAGASEDEVRKAIETGFQINRGAQSKTHSFVDDIIANTQQDIDHKEATKQSGCC